MTRLRTCVGENATFIVGVHQPSFDVTNFRRSDYLKPLGRMEDGTIVRNDANFPENDLSEPAADTIYEIANAFGFRGTTYINTAWADAKTGHPEKIMIPRPGECSFLKQFNASPFNPGLPADKSAVLDLLPHPLLVTLANVSTDPEELKALALKACNIQFDFLEDATAAGEPVGIMYKRNTSGKLIPDILDHELFEVLVNNPYLPDDYKDVLVLKPGVQGNNEITGEYLSDDGKTHVFEYLRRNSYIPWGHFASNMANDAIRYSTKELNRPDMTGIRHLYYQRIYARVAAQMDIHIPGREEGISPEELENLRHDIVEQLEKEPGTRLEFNASLWGWNFGFGYAGSGYRLHASHQMIHQQNALIPHQIPTHPGTTPLTCFSCGDLITDFIKDYRKATGMHFFDNYLQAIQHNRRTDGKSHGESSLVVFEDDHVVLFAPKAQVCEWELQLMTKKECPNILQADSAVRQSLDRAILCAVKTLETLGARFVTSIEYGGRFDLKENDQHLLYAFIPRLPYSPPTFSEAQLRWISGLYPEDFAHACRKVLNS